MCTTSTLGKPQAKKKENELSEQDVSAQDWIGFEWPAPVEGRVNVYGRVGFEHFLKVFRDSRRAARPTLRKFKKCQMDDGRRKKSTQKNVNSGENLSDLANTKAGSWNLQFNHDMNHWHHLCFLGFFVLLGEGKYVRNLNAFPHS